jgi:hypothetical protein
VAGLVLSVCRTRTVRGGRTDSGSGSELSGYKTGVKDLRWLAPVLLIGVSLWGDFHFVSVCPIRRRPAFRVDYSGDLTVSQNYRILMHTKGLRLQHRLRQELREMMAEREPPLAQRCVDLRIAFGDEDRLLDTTVPATLVPVHRQFCEAQVAFEEALRRLYVGRGLRGVDRDRCLQLALRNLRQGERWAEMGERGLRASMSFDPH